MKKVVSLFLLVTLVLSMAVGCGSTNSGDDSSKEKSLVFADTQSCTNLNPFESWNGWYVSRYGIGETLFKLNEKMEAEAFLVKSYENKDDKTWVLEIKDEVKFSNGKKVDAQAVKDSLEYSIENNDRSKELFGIESMEADGQTLTIITTDVRPAFLNSLCDPLGMIFDVNADTDITKNPIGTGPYVATGFEAKVQCTVKKNENYWNGEPKLDSATFKFLSDTSALDMATKSGEVDVAVSMPNASLGDYEDNSDFIVSSNAGSRAQLLFFNFDNKFLQDENVRKAIYMSIDKDNYANKLNNGGSTPSNGLFPDTVAYSGDKIKGYKFDVEGAKELLKEAGYEDTDNDGILEKNSEKLSLNIITYSTKAELPVFCDALKSQLKEVGIELNVSVYESIIEQSQSGDFDICLYSFTMLPTGDPEYFIDIAFKTGASSNYGHYSNEEVDKLANKLSTEFDTTKRNELATQICQIVMDDAGFAVIGHANYTYVMNKKVTNLEAHPSEYYLLDVNVGIE